VNTIGGSEDFVRRIDSEIGRSDVALVFIGDKWLEPATVSGKARVAACAVLLVAALVHFWLLARPLSASVGGPLTTLLLIGGTICGLWLGLRYEARKRKCRSRLNGSSPSQPGRGTAYRGRL
jgi:hypothetical protein